MRVPILAMAFLGFCFYPSVLFAQQSIFAWPIKASSNGRYLVDQNNVPWLMAGDTVHTLIGKISATDITSYLTDRQSKGFNSVNAYIPCGSYVRCQSDGSAFDGTRPFTTGIDPSTYDLATPNEAFWLQADRFVASAASHNLVVIFDPIETGDFLVTLQHAGTTKAFNYGVFVGNRYRNYSNIIWMHGEDFQTWNTSGTDNNLAAQVMAGIASVDTNHLQTIELNYLSSYSNQDTAALFPHLTLDFVYTYGETYDAVLSAYNSSPLLPVILGEANYEGGNDTNQLPGPAGPLVIRREAYWTMTSGAAGQIFGNTNVNHFFTGWQTALTTAATTQFGYLTTLLGLYPWWKLVPDSSHTVVTTGYGFYNAGNLNLTSASYVTTAWVPDGSLMITYAPGSSNFTVNMAKFTRAVTARWWDPTNATLTPIAGSPFANSGTHNFATPGNNSGGDSDWMLILDAATPRGDSNGDGKTDIVWQNTDGSTATWLMNGLTPSNGGTLLGPGTGWSVRQVGDFNGDGKSDIVWQNTDGSTAIWLMNGLSVIGGGGLLGPGTGWSVHQLGDFNRDGKSDIVWQNTDGSTAIWLMNGLSVISGGGLLGPGTGWSVQRIGDFNGDRKDDIVWQNTDGSTAIWLMNGLSVISGGGLLGPGTGWSVQRIGDFNGDGKSDVIWQNTDGSTAIWLMNGLSASNGGGLLGAGTGWHLAPDPG
jgi:hypothetical protein